MGVVSPLLPLRFTPIITWLPGGEIVRMLHYCLYWVITEVTQFLYCSVGIAAVVVSVTERRSLISVDSTSERFFSLKSSLAHIPGGK